MGQTIVPRCRADSYKVDNMMLHL